MPRGANRRDGAGDRADAGRRPGGGGQHLTTLPGLSATLAASLLAELGDTARASATEQETLVANAAIDLSVYSSGEFTTSRTHLSKRGCPYLRRALYLATHSAQLRNADLRAYLHKKLAEGKPYKAALVATSRKLLDRVYAVLKERRPYAAR
ncbi:MAG: transposase [Chloroflexota bacterium]